MVIEQNRMLEKQMPWMAMSKTNTHFARAVGYIVAEMAGHKPEKLPTGLTQGDISNAYYHMFIAPQLARTAKPTTQSKPIEFYGQIVNQNSQPVAGVQVHLRWTDTSANGSSEVNQSSDAQGRFSLTGTTGRMLQVWLAKDGYYVPKTNQNNFDYATGYMADPNNPVIFTLVKKGEGADLITSQRGLSRTLDFSASTRDGSPVRVDFFNRKTGTEGQLEVSQVKPAYGAWQTATGWSYRLAIPDGGFVETRDEFAFEAPASGYQPVVEFKFQKNDPNWTERIDKTFYIAFGSPRKYGRIHIETTMTTGTILEYAINPTGSRNLEPAN